MAVLHDRVIVIVGGSTGLGLSAARACVAQGARVVLVGRNPDTVLPAAESLGDAAEPVVGDATLPDTAAFAVAQALARWGRFDGLYHVAGGSGRSMGDGALHEMSDEGLDFTLKLNLTSLIYSNRAAVRQFLEAGTGGTILNMSSVLGYSPAPAHFASHAYAAAKAGIIGFTKSVAAYYAPHNIRVNAIAPALVATPMSRRAQMDDEAMAYVKLRQPLDGGRIGQPQDCDGAALYFLSDLSKYVTGQVLAVDGGWSVGS